MAMIMMKTMLRMLSAANPTVFCSFGQCSESDGGRKFTGCISPLLIHNSQPQNSIAGKGNHLLFMSQGWGVADLSWTQLVLAKLGQEPEWLPLG